MVINAACSLYGKVGESVLHVLKDYYKAREVWLDLVPSKYKALFFLLDKKRWVEINTMQGHLLELNDDVC